MAIQTTANPADVANRLQTFFDRQIIPHLEYTLVLASLPGVLEGHDVPANKGATTIRSFKKRKAKTDDIQNLTESAAIATFTEVDTGYVDISITEIGEAAKISQRLVSLDILDFIKLNSGSLAEDAALKYDTVIRNAQISGLANIDNEFEHFCGINAVNTDSSVSFATQAGLTNAQAKATRLDFLRAITQLRANLVPTIRGSYLIVYSPEAEFDLRQDQTWLDAAKNAAPDQLFKRRAFELDGCAYTQGTNPFKELATYGTHSDSGTIYSNFVFGRGAYAAPKLEGTNNGARPRLILNNKPDKSDPLNQFVVLGWKAYYGAGLRKTSATWDVPYVVNVRCKSTFNG